MSTELVIALVTVALLGGVAIGFLIGFACCADLNRRI